MNMLIRRLVANNKILIKKLVQNGGQTYKFGVWGRKNRKSWKQFLNMWYTSHSIQYTENLSPTNFVCFAKETT